jgi:Na+-translocating ferredoxin:NAD+ oxidoreductase RnfC subunit
MMTYSWLIDEIIKNIEEHTIDEFTEYMIFESMLCCQCGVCEQYACIFGLAPNKVYALVKDAILRSGQKFDFSNYRINEKALFAYRKLPAKTYARKLDLERFLGHTEFEPLGSFVPDRVRIPLCQHIGAPAVAVVKPGDTVKAGDVVGEIPENALGARAHASIDGRVEAVRDEYIEIGRS